MAHYIKSYRQHTRRMVVVGVPPMRFDAYLKLCIKLERQA